jgi:hypothetical protein
MILPIEGLSLEDLQAFIDQDLVKGEIPFEVLASHYPGLLPDWYPGYPGRPRRMNKNDPIPCRGYIKDSRVTLNDILGADMGSVDLEKGFDVKEGEYLIWLHCKNNQFSMTIASES